MTIHRLSMLIKRDDVMKKKLTITIPPIIGRLHIAYPLCVIFNDSRTLSWFHSHYIQLTCNKFITPTHNNLDFCFFDKHMDFDAPDSYIESYPWLDFKIFKREELSNEPLNLMLFIIEQIDFNYCIEVRIDEFYLPNRRATNKKHFRHSILIYGYDLERKTLNTVGFDERMKFKEDEITFKQFQQAFFSLIIDNTDSYYTTFVYKLKKHGCYETNLTLIKNQLADYLASTNTTYTIKDINKVSNLVYGLQTYDYLIKYFELLKENKAVFDIRSLHILWEHKKCMRLRVDFLLKQSFLKQEDDTLSEFKVIESNSLISRNLMLKYSLTQNTDLLERIIEIVSSIKEREEGAVEKLISSFN